MSTNLKERARELTRRFIGAHEATMDSYQQKAFDESVALVTEWGTRVQAEARRDIQTSLTWVLTKIEFPMVLDPDDSTGRQQWKGCPGCRVVWSRNMVHGENCLYLAALAQADAPATKEG